MSGQAVCIEGNRREARVAFRRRLLEGVGLGFDEVQLHQQVQVGFTVACIFIGKYLLSHPKNKKTIL